MPRYRATPLVLRVAGSFVLASVAAVLAGNLGAFVSENNGECCEIVAFAAFLWQVVTWPLVFGLSLWGFAPAKRRREVTPLHAAAATGDAQSIADLVRLGAAIEARDVDGATPLHAAVHEGQSEAATALLEAGADVDAIDETGSTALVMALVRAHHDIVPILVKAGADPDITNGLGMSGRSLARDMGVAHLID